MIQTQQFSIPKFLLSFFYLAFFNLLVQSQDLEKEFNDFQKEINDDFNETVKSQKDELTEFLQNTNKEFYSFLANSNKEFTDFLRNEWIEINDFSYNDYNKSRKPENENVYTQENSTSHSFTINSELEGHSITKYSPNSILAIQEESDMVSFQKIDLNFYGARVAISFDPSILLVNYTGNSNHEVANFWESASKTKYARTLGDLYKIKEELNLDDWSFYKLVNNLFDNVFDDNNRSLLFQWFFLNKAGYDIKIGVDNSLLYLLFAANNKVFNTPYFEVNNRKYFIFTGRPEKLKTYPSTSQQGRPLSFNQIRPLNIPYKPGFKRVNFSFESKEHSYKIPFNKNLIDLYKDYPQVELSVYANSFISAEMQNYLIAEIRPQLENIGYNKKLEFINIFVQSVNKYKTDKEQFGHEKILFPEESMQYEYADCEDRVILLTYLIRNLLNTSCIAVDFDGHAVAGIPTPETSITSNLKLNGKNYTLIDPSYKGAPVGLTSPSLASASPEAIVLFSSTLQSENSLAKVLNENCIIESTYTNSKGEVYYAGTILHKFEYKQQKLAPVANSSNSFLIKQLSNNDFRLIVSPKQGDKKQIHKVSENSNGDIYILGSFIDTLEIDDKQITTKGGEMFLAKLNNLEHIAWLKKLEISRIADSMPNFLTIYNSEGDLKYLGKQVYKTKHQAFNIEFDSINNCLIHGNVSFSGMLNIDTLLFESGNTFEIVDWLIKENSRLIKSKFNPGVSPLFAIANMISSSNINLSGSVLEVALKEMTDESLKKDEAYLQNISKIESISRQYGFITITTEAGNPVQLKNIEVENNSKLKIAEEESESRMLIYSGIKWGYDTNWHKVNYILIRKNTGEILYDYDQHYRNKIPARQIIIK